MLPFSHMPDRFASTRSATVATRREALLAKLTHYPKNDKLRFPGYRGSFVGGARVGVR